MIESYAVGAVFRLTDEASPVLRNISEKLVALEKLMGRVQGAFKSINDTRVGSFASGLNGINDKLSAIGTKAEGIGSKLRSGFQSTDTAIVDTGRKLEGFGNAFNSVEAKAKTAMESVAGSVKVADTSIISSADNAARLATELRTAATAARDIPRLPGMGGGAGSGGGGGSHPRPGHSGPSHAEVGMNLGMLGGMGLHEVVEGFHHLIEAGARLEKFQAQLQAATGDMAKVADATAAAWEETGKNLTTNVSDNLKNLQHLMNVVGSLDEAKQMLHPFTMVDTALGSIKDESVAGGKGSKALELNAYNVARSLEQLGVTQDEEKLNSYVGNITRMMIGMRGLVDGSKLYNAINNAGGSRYAWDEDFTTYGLGPLIQATNGRAGAQLYQLNRSFYQGVSTKMMAEGAEKYGLWKEEDEVYEAGKFKGMKVGSIFEADVLQKNPVKWAGDVREMMRGRGVDVDDTDTMTKVIAEATRGNKNLGAIMDELVLPNAYKALIKERGNIKAVPEDAVSILQKHDPGVAMKAFNEQFENLLTALGKPTVSQVADTLNKLAGGLNVLAQWAEKNPNAGKALTEGAVALGGALGILTGVGVIGALAFFLPGGAAAIGIAALVSVAGTITAFHWQELGLSMDNFHKNIASISGAFDTINAALTRFFTGLVDTMRKIPGLGRFIPGDAGTPGVPLPPDRSALDAPDSNGNALRRGDEMPAGFHRTAFGGFEGANDNSPMVDLLALGVFKGLKMYASGGAGADGVGGAGGGIINASFGGGGFGGAGSGDSPLLRGARNGLGGSNPYAGGAGGGSFVAPGDYATTAGMRQNNLGNMGFFRGMHYAGLIGPSNAIDVDHSIAKFATQEDGIRAAAALALAKYHGGKLNTWDLIAGRPVNGKATLQGAWTPGSLGGGASANIAAAMGLSNHDDLHLDNPDRMVAFLHGLALQEHGQKAGGWYTQDRIRAALAGKSSAGPSPTASDPRYPGLVRGTLTIGGESFAYGSGGASGSAHVPWGDYPIGPDSGNPWGRAHNAMDVNGNGSMWDGSLGRMRTGIEMHAAHTAAMITHGCLGFIASEYPKLKERVREMVAKSGHAYLHVGPNGASITPDRVQTVTAPPPRKVSPGTPSIPPGPMTTADARPHQHHIYLDGKAIAKVVTKHQAVAARHPTDMGGPDLHGHYTSPGTPITDAA